MEIDARHIKTPIMTRERRRVAFNGDVVVVPDPTSLHQRLKDAI